MSCGLRLPSVPFRHKTSGPFHLHECQWIHSRDDVQQCLHAGHQFSLAVSSHEIEGRIDMNF